MLLPLHSLALQAYGHLAGDCYDIAHEMAHLKGTHHHHSDDGALHYDDSTASEQHLSDHSASQIALGLPTQIFAIPSYRPTTAVLTHVHQHISDPVLDPLQRPPSFLA